MTTRVSYIVVFERELRRLKRKFPQVIQEVRALGERLRNDERPGDRLQNVGYDAYKVRLANTSAGRGKSGGFRAVYYVHVETQVFVLTLYSKTEQEDVAASYIRSLIETYVLPAVSEEHNEASDLSPDEDAT